jgi:hypothetical protein
LAAGVIAGVAWLPTGCGSGADLMSTVALPSQQSTGTADGVDMGLTAEAGPQSGKLVLTPAQRGYLDDLTAAGVHPSSELRALSIGSYVCQARGAGQGDDAVRDSVAPMVRSDVAKSNASAPQSASVIQADAAIDAIAARGRVPVVVGGTPLYLKVAIYGGWSRLRVDGQG